MTIVAKAERVPPLSEQLEFARNTTTRRVHILCSEDARHWVPVTRMSAEASAILSLIASPCRMLCGAKLRVSSAEMAHIAVWEAGSNIEDYDLCIRCVQALGEDSWRAFHSDNRCETLEVDADE